MAWMGPVERWRYPIFADLWVFSIFFGRGSHWPDPIPWQEDWSDGSEDPDPNPFRRARRTRGKHRTREDGLRDGLVAIRDDGTISRILNP